MHAGIGDGEALAATVIGIDTPAETTHRQVLESPTKNQNNR
jgi:hypothetical protein